MNKTSILSLALLALAGLPASASLIATATITPSQIDATDYHYDIVLNDTGTTTVGTFWFAWKPGQDFMPVQPTNILSPANWTDLVTGGGPGDGFAIQWVASAGSELAAGASLPGFSFNSTATPAQIAGDSQFFDNPPVGTSFVYSLTPFSDPGFSFVAASNPLASSAPEPATFGLGAAALVLLPGARRIFRRKRA